MQLQIPREKWIYPLGGAGFKERELCRCIPESSSEGSLI